MAVRSVSLRGRRICTARCSWCRRCREIVELHRVVVIVLAPAGAFRIRTENIVHDSGEPEPWPDALGIEAPQLAVHHLPAECVQYLLASRYCEVDSELNEFAVTPTGEKAAP